MELDYINIVGNIAFAIAFWVGMGVLFGGIRQLLWSSTYPKGSALKLCLKGPLIAIEIAVRQPWLFDPLKEKDLIEEVDKFNRNLPSIGIGKALPSKEMFSGSERVFYDFFREILGAQKTERIIDLHGFERSALYGLCNEAKRQRPISSMTLLGLANGNPELIGFAFQMPTSCESWIIPAEHYLAEIRVGNAIKVSLKRNKP